MTATRIEGNCIEARGVDGLNYADIATLIKLAQKKNVSLSIVGCQILLQPSRKSKKSAAKPKTFKKSPQPTCQECGRPDSSLRRKPHV